MRWFSVEQMIGVLKQARGGSSGCGSDLNASDDT